MDLTQENADQLTRADVDASRGALVLEFGSRTCGHCIAAQPKIAEAFAGFEGIPHLRIEDGRGRPLGRSFAVKLWPTLVFLRDGIECARVVRPSASAELCDGLRALQPE